MSGSTKRPERAAAVVGAGGFLGTHLCQALRLGGYPVITLQAGQEMPCDVTTVFFVAGRVTPANATESADLVAAELAAFRQTLDAAHCAGRSRRVVLASSGGTLYAQSCQPPYREGHPVAPNNAYGAMKLAMESMLLARGGIEPVAVRLANLYGPGQRARRGLGVVAHWIDALGAGRSITVLGEPDSTRDYLYSDDAVNLFVRLHSASQVPAVVNAGSGAPTTLAELARLMLDAAQCTNRQIHYAPSRAADRMQRMAQHRSGACNRWLGTADNPAYRARPNLGVWQSLFATLTTNPDRLFIGQRPARHRSASRALNPRG